MSRRLGDAQARCIRLALREGSRLLARRARGRHHRSRRHRADWRGRQVLRAGDMYLQTQRCLAIIAQALTDAGADVRHVVRTPIMLTDMTRWREAHARTAKCSRTSARLHVRRGVRLHRSRMARGDRSQRGGGLTRQRASPAFLARVCLRQAQADSTWMGALTAVCVTLSLSKRDVIDGSAATEHRHRRFR